MVKETIEISPDLKEKLDSLKIDSDETYDDIIKRLVVYYNVKVNIFSSEEVNQQIRDYLNDHRCIDNPEDLVKVSRMLFELSS